MAKQVSNSFFTKPGLVLQGVDDFERLAMAA
jgi:hypothetical protein